MTHEKLIKLNELYYSHKNNCCKCGCSICDNTGMGLGAVFVLDKDGNFYCSNCDTHFEDGDERIFDADLYEHDLDEEEFVDYIQTSFQLGQEGTNLVQAAVDYACANTDNSEAREQLLLSLLSPIGVEAADVNRLFFGD